MRSVSFMKLLRGVICPKIKVALHQRDNCSKNIQTEKQDLVIYMKV